MDDLLVLGILQWEICINTFWAAIDTTGVMVRLLNCREVNFLVTEPLHSVGDPKLITYSVVDLPHTSHNSSEDKVVKRRAMDTNGLGQPGLYPRPSNLESIPIPQDF